MKSYIAMGIFAFIVSGISLLRIMYDREFYRLTAMKRAWGRSRGLALHFLSAVVVPLVCGVVFMSGGISGVSLVKPLVSDNPFTAGSRFDDVYRPREAFPVASEFFTTLA